MTAAAPINLMSLTSRLIILNNNNPLRSQSRKRGVRMVMLNPCGRQAMCNQILPMPMVTMLRKVVLNGMNKRLARSTMHPLNVRHRPKTVQMLLMMMMNLMNNMTKKKERTMNTANKSPPKSAYIPHFSRSQVYLKQHGITWTLYLRCVIHHHLCANRLPRMMRIRVVYM